MGYGDKMTVNCSQAKFLAIILVFFNAIIRLTDYSSHLFDFSFAKTKLTGSAELPLSGRAALLKPYALLVSQYPIHQNCFEETISRCEGPSLPPLSHLHSRKTRHPVHPPLTASPDVRAIRPTLVGYPRISAILIKGKHTGSY